tara:strand:+ start:1118 stop:1261 length:144 start_codon:yes stop_codon:yes gene_type:complete
MLIRYKPQAGAGGAHFRRFFDLNDFLKSLTFHFLVPKYLIQPTIDLT